MGIDKSYFCTCDECGRYYGKAVNEPSSLCNVSVAYHAKDFSEMVRRLIISKWIETVKGWLCNECQEKIQKPSERK